jgi:AraC-like DNA-binding protein
MQKVVIPSGFGDTPRGFDTFEPLPSIPGLSSADLDLYLEALQVQPISAIEWKWDGGWKVGPRALNDSMWFWFESGRGSGWVGDPHRSFRLQAGDLVMIPQGARHTLQADRDSTMKLVAVHFHAQVFGALNVLRLLGLPSYISRESAFGSASRQLCREFAVKQGGWQMAMRWIIQSMLLHIVRAHARRCKVVYHMLSQKDLPRLLPAFEFIDHNLSNRSLNVNAVSETAFLSEVQFRKVFKDATGLSPAKFIQRRRVERSCVLLRTTQSSIEQIAYDCGFTDTPYFYRVFRRWMSASPHSYRHSGRPL